MEKEDQKAEQEQEEFTYEMLIDGLKAKKFKKIVFMTGAGISVSAGIPDFRSPKTGLFDNLKEFDLPRPEAIFDIDFFLEKPEAFYKLAKTFMDLEKFEATPTHHFCKMLYDKEMVLHYLTQNIDNLESKAGFTDDQNVMAHGGNRGASGAKCKKLQDRKKLEEHMAKGEVMFCKDESCLCPVKPDITFYGEGLPMTFMEILMTIGAEDADLLIVIGTALAVGPFNQVVNILEKKCPAVLINMENTKEQGYNFDDKKSYPQRLFMQGKCDDTIHKISADCGWTDELNARVKAKPGIDDLQEQMGKLDIQDEKKDQIQSQAKAQVEEKKEAPATDPEEGPIMGFFAVHPIKECPHCIPDKFIAPMEDFKDLTIGTPCNHPDCDHSKENWVCLQCKYIGCSRYVNSHMVAHNEAEKHPIALSFADFSFWCYECDSYVTSKHLNHVQHFYPQKFGTEEAGILQEYAAAMDSKAKK